MPKLVKNFQTGLEKCALGARSFVIRHQLVFRSIVCGLTAVVLADTILLYVLADIVGLWYLYASVVAFISSILISFFLQKFWAFKDSSLEGVHGQFAMFFGIAVFDVFLNVFIVYMLVEYSNIWYIFSQIISASLIGVFNFLIYAALVFRRDKIGENPKILIAAGIFPPEIGGPATHTFQLLKEFTKRGLDVGVVTYSNFKKVPEIDGCFNVERIKRGFWGFYHFSYLFWLSLHTFNYDLIYAQDISGSGVPAIIAKLVTKRRLFIRIGGDLLWERLFLRGKIQVSALDFYRSGQYKRRLSFWLYRAIIMSAEKIIVTSEILVKIYRDYYKIPAQKIVLLQNPIYKGESEDAVLTGEARNILFAGRFINYKNIDTLIKAFNNIHSKIAPAKLILIGDGPEKSRYLFLIKNLNLSGKVDVINSVPHERLAEYIHSSHLCLAPAFTEFNPNFALECLSLGKPVLVSRENGLTVRLPEEFLFDPKNQKELEDKIVNIILGRVEKKIDEDDLAKLPSWDDIINRHLNIFRS